jgi:hypothetical protein
MVSFGETHVFLQLSFIGLFGGNKTNPGLKHLSCRKYSFQKLTEFSQVNKVQDDPDSNIRGFFGDIHVFHYFNFISPFGANRANLPLEIPKLQEVFHYKP